MAETVFRWDLDKTYLVSHFESLRELVRIPFQSGADKQAVPGVVSLIRALRLRSERRGDRTAVYFLSASPPQIGSAIREKLQMDGIVYEGITFKHQVRHLIRARFDIVREQIGYKLDRLLAAASESRPGTRELLFGDDWESDPFIYSLYADVVAGRIGREQLAALLERAGVNKTFVSSIDERVAAFGSDLPDISVVGIHILRQRPAAPAALDAFGPRVIWFDDYFECALGLYARDWLGPADVSSVALEVGFDSEELAGRFDAVAERGTVDRAWLSGIAGALTRARRMDPVRRGHPLRRLGGVIRRALDLSPAPPPPLGYLPDYGALVDRWSRAGRKEGLGDTEDAGRRSDDRDG
ncbi:MAG: phosphatase domain-containing protein [Candidatus Binatia bacterium]